MAGKTRIAWTDMVWNPIRGCTPVSEGCRNCYAARQALRFAGEGGAYAGLVRRTPGGPRWTGEVRLVPEVLMAPLHWRTPKKIFVNSMGDIFHPLVPEEWLDKVFAVMALCPQHTFQLLTKRPRRMVEYLLNLPRRAANTPALANRCIPYEDGRICQLLRNALGPGTPVIERNWPLKNVWVLVSIEDQATADERLPWLLRAPAAVRGVSLEPMLGPVDFLAVRPDAWTVLNVLEGVGYTTRPAAMGQTIPNVWTERVDWVIVGGETGPGARPLNPQWVRDVRDQCVEAGVAFWFKSWGEWAPVHELRVNEPGIKGKPWFHFDPDTAVCRVGRRRAGAVLGDREWQQWPGEGSIPDREEAVAGGCTIPE